MGDIRIAISQMEEPRKSIYQLIDDYFILLKGLENEPIEHKGGKKATLMVMMAGDIERLIEKYYPCPEIVEISPIVPSDFRIQEKSKEISDNELHNEGFVIGANWMRKMLINK